MTETTFPQPREGVVGVARDDTLLSLEDDAMPAREMVIGLAFHLWGATLVGNPAPVVERMGNRMRYPQVGDLVLETSVRARPDVGAVLHCLGYLLAEREEWVHTDDEWAAASQDEWADERPTDRAWYVQYGPAAVDVVRWLNCIFIAVPAPGERFT